MYTATGTKAIDKAQFITEFTPLVKRIAYHMMTRLPASVQVDDLIQAGMIGLLDAINRYEGSYGRQFESYAAQRIRGSILDELREAHKIVTLSVTEGEDKPLKYPDMFHAADLMLLNKCDLLPHLTFDVDLAIEYAHRIHPAMPVIQISATQGSGMPEWVDWIMAGCRSAATATAKQDLKQFDSTFG